MVLHNSSGFLFFGMLNETYIHVQQEATHEHSVDLRKQRHVGHGAHAL